MEFDRENVQSWLDAHWTGSRKCPICQQNTWVLLERVWEFREFHGGGLRVGGSHSVLPVVAIMCNACGYMILLNAIAVKAVSRATPQEEGK